MMYSMKEVCEQIGMNYETLKYYCKEGLVPHVQRDKNNYRTFDEKNIAWLKGLQCLRKCGMSIKDMKKYMNYCLEGPSTIPQRKQMLKETKENLLLKLQDIHESIDYIDYKQDYYDQILSGEKEYTSHLINIDDPKCF